MNIEYEVSSAVLEEELENLTTHIAGHVYEHDDDGNKISIAHIQASLVDVATAGEYDDAPLKEVFWRGSNELQSVYNALYDPSAPACQYLDTQLDWNWAFEKDSRNFMLIDLVTVMPSFRRQELALMTIYRTLQRFAADTLLVAMDVRPLQFRENYTQPVELKLDRFNTNFDSALAKLQFYFELMGFRAIPNLPYMVLNLDCNKPWIDDFCCPVKISKGVSVN